MDLDNGFLLLKRITVLIVLAFTLIVSSGCEVMPKEAPQLSPPAQSTPKVDYTTVAVARGSIEDIAKNINGQFVCPAKVDIMYGEKGMTLKQINVKVDDYVQAGDVVAEADSSELQDTIKQKELNLQKLNLDYQQKHANGADEYDLKKLQIDIDVANEEIQELYKNLDMTKLIAPVSGKVSFVEKLQEGDAIDAKKILVSIADTSQLYFECTDTEQLKIGKVGIGMQATVYYNNNNYNAEIISTPRDNTTTGDTKIRLKIKDFYDVKAIGQTGTFNVLIQTKDNVIKTKNSYVNKQDNSAYVNVLENGVKTKRAVQTGIVTSGTNAEVEIISGLNEGDLVIVDK